MSKGTLSIVPPRDPEERNDRASSANGDPQLPCSNGRAEWLVEEIGAYLAADAPLEERSTIARTALRNSHASFSRFVESRLDPYAVVGTEVAIRRRNGHLCRFAYAEPPGPVSFLVFCAANCADGDEVTVRQVTALAGTVGTTESWPFGLACAEQMTLPAGARLVADAVSSGRCAD